MDTKKLDKDSTALIRSQWQGWCEILVTVTCGGCGAVGDEFTSDGEEVELPTIEAVTDLVEKAEWSVGNDGLRCPSCAHES